MENKGDIAALETQINDMKSQSKKTLEKLDIQIDSGEYIMNELSNSISLNRGIYIGLVLGIGGNLLVSLLYDLLTEKLPFIIKLIISILIMAVIFVFSKKLINYTKDLSESKIELRKFVKNAKHMRNKLSNAL